MAPRSVASTSGSSRAHDKAAVRTDAVNPRKRAAASPEEEQEADEPELQLGAGDELDSEEDGEFEPESDAEGSDGAEAFPELDSGSSGDDESDSEELPEDEDEGSDEEGYNSSDIDALYASDSDDDADDGLGPDEKLERLIKRNISKPAEVDPQVGLGKGGKKSQAKEGVGKLVPSRLVPGGMKREYEDYEAGYGSESSTEDNPNAVGNIPMEWYDDLPHIGYDVNGKKVMRPAKGDELDKFLATVEDPDSWTTAEDKLLQKQVQLTDKELDIIRRLQNAEVPDGDYDPYQDTIEWFTGKGKEMAMPLSAAPEPKRRFVPSKWEHKKVMKIVKAIREGRIIPNKPAVTKPTVYALWSNADTPNAPHAMYMPAPQLPPPKTAESYNPPEEYLPTDAERADWEALDKEDRKADFLPAKYDALRKVPGYANLVQEKFERCLDLYLAPRTRKVKLNIDPESLIPSLPNPRELRPFPVACAVQYRHPENTRTRAVSVSPSGEWLASGSEDGIVRIWDAGNGREVWRWDLKAGAVHAVEWSPNKDEAMLVALVQGRAYVLAPLALVSPKIATATITHTNTAFSSSAATTSSANVKHTEIKWTRPSEGERDRGVLVYVELAGTPKKITWHRKGDYFATVAIEAANKSVLIHQLSKHQTQSPFKKTKGAVQCVAFHPHKPHFFVATQRYVRLYDLVAQQLLKTLQPGLKWISSMDIHPLGDNLIIGSYDKKLCWFDLDLSTKPYKTLRYHAKALRSVAYHPTYPLFASSSDDGTIHIFHGTVYSDLMQNPLIVPLKVLRGHRVTDGLGVLDIRWHPEKPWLVSSGADGEVRMWSC